MDDDADFNSSDLEFEPPPPNPFSQAGKASLEAIIENATADRITSKKFSKQLTFTKGRKGTQYNNQLWLRRFEGFREHSLKVDIKQTPTGEQIERFLCSIVALVKPTTNAVPSYAWLTGGLRHLLISLVFQHEKFSLSRHETSRISTAVDELVNQGKLTREPSRQRNWVGVFILRKITTAMMVDALTRGTLNWDVTLSKVTSIVLTAALSARAGDILTDRLDDQPLPYLCYQDIKLKLVGGQAVEHLVAEVEIRNEKSKKNNPMKNRRVLLHSLPNASDNCLCPIKLVLILALRSGNVDGESIDDVLASARATRDQSVRWKQPERSVICSIAAGGAALQPDKPANRVQVSKTLADGGLLAGVLARLASHDIRRGAARDTANLRSKIKGLATEAVAATMGQSKETYDRGITAAYVGSTISDTWSSRVKEDYQDPFGLQVSDTPIVKRRKLTSSEVSTLCTTEGLDSSDSKARARAAYISKGKSVGDWIATELHRDDRVLSEQTPSRINASGRRDAAATPPQQQPAPNDDGETDGIDTAPANAGEVDDGGIDGVDFGEELNLEYVITDSDNATMTEAVEEAIFDQMLDPNVNPAIHCDPVDFVRRFSTINITRNQSLVRPLRQTETALANYSGNSRDPVTFLEMPCVNASLGCDYRTASQVLLTSHEKFCPATRQDGRSTAKADYAFRCDREGCSSAFDAQWKLNAHVKECHEWMERSCVKPGCDGSVVFQTNAEYRDHCAKFHSGFVPMSCTVPGYTSKTVFRIPKTYLAHLSKQHNLHGKERDQYRQPPPSAST